MNESKKTGVFWGAAAITLALAAMIAWPVPTKNEDGTIINTPLFPEFKDPLTAASLKVVTFDDVEGRLETFEVRKDRQTGVWTIPSRNGYPADAVEQMRDAANSLVDLKVLDIQTENAEDHDDLGVVEPKLEDLEIGDEGVGRLVTFKDSDQKTLASLIVGKPLKGEPGKIYVRKPGQDPVYVVKLEEKPLTTRFQDWIEDDLLKLSSIDIKNIVIKDYSAALNVGGNVSLNRNYNATLEMDGAQWKLKDLLEFDSKNPLAEPKVVDVAADAKLNTTKLNEIKNALDDLKIANVLRKPEGMSANLRASKDLLSNEEAVSSLMSRGFLPVMSAGQDDVEILSANGELTVGLKDGVEYVLRFGNVSGLGESNGDSTESSKSDEAKSEKKDEPASGGVNRYLLVTTRVVDNHFPAPDLKPVPQTLEELEAMEAAAKAAAEGNSASPSEPTATESAPKEPATTEPTPAEDSPKNEMKPEDSPAEAKSETEASDSKASDSGPKEKVDAAKQEASKQDDPALKPEEPAPAEEAPTAKDSDSDQPAPNTESSDARVAGDSAVMLVTAQQDSDTKDDASLDAPDQAKKETNDAADTPPPDVPQADAPKADAPSDEAKQAEMKSEAKPAGEELTPEEKQERLESEQEKITKENQRKIDERKDKVEAAERKVRDLNARFADWYYVIPEDTYRKLRINRDELFAKDAPPASPQNPSLPPFGNLPPIPGE